jgi:hypothetical protein
MRPESLSVRTALILHCLPQMHRCAAFCSAVIDASLYTAAFVVPTTGARASVVHASIWAERT